MVLKLITRASLLKSRLKLKLRYGRCDKKLAHRQPENVFFDTSLLTWQNGPTYLFYIPRVHSFRNAAKQSNRTRWKWLVL